MKASSEQSQRPPHTHVGLTLQRRAREIHMLNFRIIAMVLVFGGVATAPSVVQAGCFDLADCWPRCISSFCCDDYCSKPVPGVRKTCCFTCDDYCPKQSPCVRRICSRTCDDYCRKPIPRINCPTCLRSGCLPGKRGNDRGCGETGCLNCKRRAR